MNFLNSPAKTGFIAIDESLANSKLQWLVWGSVALGLGLLIFGLNLPFSYQLGLAILLVVCIAVSQLLPFHVIAISTLPLPASSKMDSFGEVEWQLGITQLEAGNFFTPNRQTAQLWQAALIKADYYQVAVVLSFAVVTPLEKNVTLMIWQDQVTDDTWRQLCVLAKL